MQSLSLVSLIATIVLFGAAIFLGVQNRTEAVKNRLKLEYLQKQFEARETGEPGSSIETQLMQQAAIAAKLNEDHVVARGQEEIARLNRELEIQTQERKQLDNTFKKIQDEDSRPLTREQEKVTQAAAIAKVTEFVPDMGFVALNAGLDRNMQVGARYHIRRGNFIIAEVTIGDTVEDSSCIADVASGSIPQGYTIEPGDEVVQLLP